MHLPAPLARRGKGHGWLHGDERGKSPPGAVVARCDKESPPRAGAGDVVSREKSPRGECAHASSARSVQHHEIRAIGKRRRAAPHGHSCFRAVLGGDATIRVEDRPRDATALLPPGADAPGDESLTARIHGERGMAAFVYLERGLQQFAPDSIKFEIQDALPACELDSDEQRYGDELANRLEQTAWEGEALQAVIFATAQAQGLAPRTAFKTLYRLFLDREAGPKLGPFLASLEPEFVIRRIRRLG